MKKRDAKKIATWIIVPLMLAIFILDIMTVALGNHYARRYTFTKENFTNENGNDRIHFLNTGNSDCILLESDGKFALIDAGEGSRNPRKSVAYQGHEQTVINYLKSIAPDSEGTVHLEFILGTHAHYDHIGSFEAVISDSSVEIQTAYFKEFDREIAKDYEVESWHVNDVYSSTIAALRAKEVKVESNIPEKMTFGGFELEFYNTKTPPELKGEGENAASVGVKVTKGKKTAFLAADITKSCGLEELLGDDIGDIDLLKAGHHGYFGSSSASFLKKLTPEIIIVTNHLGKVYPNVKWNFTMVAKASFYSTCEHNGIIATFTDNNEIILTDNIH